MLLPKWLRKLVGVFRGDVAPLLILLSTLLGLWFGLVPGWSGFHLVLVLLALIINVNLALFVLAALAGRALCYAAAPLLYYAGRALHEPVEPLLRALENTPILGLTDFSRYAVSGALILGPLLGLVLGLLLAKVVGAFRRGWLTLEEGSEALRRWQAKWWVRGLDRLLFGRRTKDVRGVLTRRPRLVRWPGVVAAVLLLGICGVGLYAIKHGAAAGLIAQSLSRANGAEVNLDTLSLAPLRGRLAATGLKVTDPAAPQRNRLAAEEVVADLGVWPLLCGRIVVDEVVLSEAAFNQPRATPGEVYRAIEPAEEEAARAQRTFDLSRYELPERIGDIARLREYFASLEEFNAWVDFLTDWIPEPQPEVAPPPAPDTYLAYLSARAPRPPAPRVLVHSGRLENLTLPSLNIPQGRLTLANLSDAPYAAGRPMSISLAPGSGDYEVGLTVHYEKADIPTTLEGRFENIDLGAFQQALSGQNPVVLEAGTAAAELSGTLTRSTIDATLAVDLRDLRLRSRGGSLFGLDPQVTAEALQAVSALDTTIRIIGPLREPRVVFDAGQLIDEFRAALLAAGKAEIANRLDQLMREQLGVEGPSLEEAAENPLGAAGEMLGGLLDPGGDAKTKRKEEGAGGETKPQTQPAENPLDRLRKRLKK